VRSDKHLTGAGFAPAATWLDFGPHAVDLLVIPDASTLLQVPSETVFVCFLWKNAKSLVQSIESYDALALGLASWRGTFQP
jgi:hypothetical protein